ncbi:hypothetical protein ACFC0N_20650 [Streptomyces zaomyceticus]|uniref:hypothetical protein n=1 Tax=Streptomyces zaomyceticus TaxID=68286 RepID=UPI0035D5B9B0
MHESRNDTFDSMASGGDLDRILTAAGVADAGVIWRTTAGLWGAVFFLLYSPLSVKRWGAPPVHDEPSGSAVIHRPRAEGPRLGRGPSVWCRY